MIKSPTHPVLAFFLSLPERPRDSMRLVYGLALLQRIALPLWIVIIGVTLFAGLMLTAVGCCFGLVLTLLSALLNRRARHVSAMLLLMIAILLPVLAGTIDIGANAGLFWLLLPLFLLPSLSAWTTPIKRTLLHLIPPGFLLGCVVVFQLFGFPVSPLHPLPLSSANLLSFLLLLMALAIYTAISIPLSVQTAQGEKETDTAYKKLALVAATDKVTGLPEKKRAILDMEWMIADSIPFSVCLLLIQDLPAFTKANGMECVDRLVSELSRTVRNIAPNHALLYRTASDHLFFTLPGGNEADAEQLLRKAIATVEKNAIHYRGRELKVSLKGGIAVHANGQQASVVMAGALASL